MVTYYRFALVFFGMGLMHMQYAQAMQDEVEATTRCVHGTPLAPSGVVCCTPKDAYFRNLTVLDTTITGSLIIENGGSITCNCSVVMTCSLVATGTACDGIFNNFTAAENIEAGYYDALDRHEVLTSNADIYDVFGNEVELFAFDGVPGDFFGSAVAISAKGTFVAVGASHKNGNSGEIYIFRRDVNNTWNIMQAIDSPTAASNYGAAIALSDDASVMAVGAPTQAGTPPNGTGAVYLYLLDPITGLYSPFQTILNPDSSISDQFGSAVDLSATGAYLVVGDPGFSGAESGQGTSYIYQRTASCLTCLGLTSSVSNWNLQQQLLEQTPVTNGSFGRAVSISEDGGFAIVGAPGSGINNAGLAYVFQQSAAVWSPMATLAPSDSLAPYSFGLSVGISGDGLYAIVGAPAQSGTGLGYIFYRSDIVWNNQQIIAPQTAGTISFGFAVGISNDGTKTVIGGLNNTTANGLIESYDRFDQFWNYVETISASDDTISSNAFGSELAISADGSFLISGAPTTPPGAQGEAYIYAPRCAFVPTDLTVSGSLCVQGTASVNGDIFVGGQLFYGGAAPTASVVAPCGICSSDKFLKEDIRPLDGARALALLNALRPVTFCWKRPDLHTELGDEPVGFISQEIRKQFPHWVSEREPHAAEKHLMAGEREQMLAIKPDIFALLVAALQKVQHDRDLVERTVQQLSVISEVEK